MTLLEKLLKRLPKKYHDRVVDIEAENDLVDDCKTCSIIAMTTLMAIVTKVVIQ